MLYPGKNYVNSPVRLGFHMEDQALGDVDPVTVKCSVLSPSGTKTTYVYGTDSNVYRLDTGDYTCDVTPDRAGRWHYRWETTGAGRTLALEGNFLVQKSEFFDGYDIWRDWC
jgi:hypothetical protein